MAIFGPFSIVVVCIGISRGLFPAAFDGDLGKQLPPKRIPGGRTFAGRRNPLSDRENSGYVPIRHEPILDRARYLRPKLGDRRGISGDIRRQIKFVC